MNGSISGFRRRESRDLLLFFYEDFSSFIFLSFFFPRFCEASNGWLIFFWFEVPLGLELICRRVTSFRWELNVKWIGQHWCLGAR